MNNTDLLVNYLTLHFMNKEEIIEAEVDSHIEKLKVFDAFSNETDEFFVTGKSIFTSRFAIKLEKGAVIDDKKHKKWFLNKKLDLDMKYWERYKNYLIYDQKFPVEVVNIMDDILDTTTDLLGDPDLENDFQRRGLIVGDVQSGKTSNYTGLICKAADSNYKAIVLLTGTIEKLRKQTQMRLDEGFVGFDSSAMIKDKKDMHIGVSKFDKSVKVVVLTSTLDDFKSKTANSLGFDLNSFTRPVLFVVKKNVSVLKRLNKWLCTFNQNGEEPIDHSLLLIDDEADNASINTNPEDRNPTTINDQITDLLAAFRKSSYVGYTATPYANIFIDPSTDEQMGKEDLFPKDYIYALNPPSNYIGARNIFGDSGKHKQICNIFTSYEEEEIEELLPMKHKKDHLIDILPRSMVKAVHIYLISNVIRDLRGDKKKHRSMLINVSRFTDVQKEIGNMVNNELKAVQNSARLFSKVGIDEALKDSNMLALYNVYIKEFSGFEYTWEEIQNNLYHGIGTVKVFIINQKSDDKLDYEEYEDGLRVIAIGGLSLSRGLTLEGLMMSYLYRSTKMYDTLLQMGRWFGYRPNYDDLCKIFMTETSYDWYNQISEATDELRRDIKRYENSGLTPLEFGLRVRSDKNALLVTARNKMRSSNKVSCTISMSEEAIETTDLFVSKSKNKYNAMLVSDLIKDSIDGGSVVEKFGSAFALRNVKKDIILSLLDSIEIPPTNEYLDPPIIHEFIKQYRGIELENWDIGFVNGSSSESFKIQDEEEVNLVVRSFSTIGNNDEIVRMSGKSRRLGNVNDGRIGLDIDPKEIKNRIYSIEKNYYNSKPRNLKQKDYFIEEYIQTKRNPLLTIYNIQLKYDEDGKMHIGKTSNEKEVLNKFKGKVVIGIGIGIPKLMNTETKYASYQVNRIYQELTNEYDIGDEE